MKFDVFLSYNFDDSAAVDYITQKLRNEGFSVWRDRDELLAGEPLIAGLERGLESSKNIIVCVGKPGIGAWQLPEIQIALDFSITDHSRRVIPVLLPDAPEDIKLPSFLKKNLWIDFRHGFTQDEEWDRLLRSISGQPKPQQKSDVNILDTKIPPASAIIRRAVSVALMKDDHVLLLKRSKSQKNGAGLWQLPGGKMDQYETPIATAIREIHEEVGYYLDKTAITYITDLTDAWLDRKTGKAMVMSLLYSAAPDKEVQLASEFETFEWVHLDKLFSRGDIIFFGATGRLLQILRRYFRLHLPLSYIAEMIENIGHAQTSLPEITGLGTEATQILYSILSLLGFIDDKGPFRPSSILSASIIRTLSAWALTEEQIFEAQGSSDWYSDAVRLGGKLEIERFRSRLFEQHQSLLGLLSHRLAKALSSRSVCDILLTSVSQENGKIYVLLRWDFHAKKFQIPARGLEMIEGKQSSVNAAHYVVSERLDKNFVDKLEYEYIGGLVTAHVSAGSLDDGPLMRGYHISVYRLEAKQNEEEYIIKGLDNLNNETLRILRDSNDLASIQRRRLPFYLWAELDLLKQERFSLLNRKLQGFDELVKAFGISIFENQKNPLILKPDSTELPILSLTDHRRYDILSSVISDS